MAEERSAEHRFNKRTNNHPCIAHNSAPTEYVYALISHQINLSALSKLGPVFLSPLPLNIDEFSFDWLEIEVTANLLPAVRPVMCTDKHPHKKK